MREVRTENSEEIPHRLLDNDIIEDTGSGGRLS